MKINLSEFVPEHINKKKVIVGLTAERLPIGRKIKSFEGKIADIKIKEINGKENPRLRILKALSMRDMNFEELAKETRLSYDNLRWYMIRNKNSLLKEGMVGIKERKTCFYKNAKGGCVKIIWTLIEKGRKELLYIKKETNLPRRKELILTGSNGEEFVLSSWWSSWLKPNIEDLEFDEQEKRFVYEIPENQILIQYEKSKGTIYSVILPKEIEVNDEVFITSLGLLLGEMRKRKGDISFSNTEPFLANYVLNSLEYFGASKNNFKFNIQVNTKNFKPNHGDLIEYWANELGLEKNKISSVFEYENYGTNRSEFGRIDFIYWNIVLKEIINNLINYFLQNIENNKNYATYMLRGLLAAEGYVSASSISGALDRVAISSCSNYNKKQIVKLLSVLEIGSSIQDNCVRISSKENFNKIIKYNLLKISKDKEKFKNLYNKFKYDKSKLINL